MRGDAVVDEKCHIRGQWRRQRQRARGRSCTRSTRFPASKSVLAPSERAGKCVNTLVSGRGLDHDGVDEGRGFSERWTTRAAHFFHVLVGDRCRWRHSPRCQRRSKSGALLVYSYGTWHRLGSGERFWWPFKFTHMKFLCAMLVLRRRYSPDLFLPKMTPGTTNVGRVEGQAPFRPVAKVLWCPKAALVVDRQIDCCG